MILSDRIDYIFRWLSHVDGRPGLSTHAFQLIDNLRKGPNGWQYSMCAVTIDGMSLKAGIDWDPKSSKMVGNVNFGDDLDQEGRVKATEALVVMAVGIKGHWKVPIAYATIAGIKATTQYQFLKQCFLKLFSVNCIPVSLTMDGHPVNIKMLENFNCFIRESIGRPLTINIETLPPIHVIPDACHINRL